MMHRRSGRSWQGRGRETFNPKRSDVFREANAFEARSYDSLKHGLQDVCWLGLVPRRRTCWRDMVVRNHVVDQQRHCDRKAASDHAGRQTGTLRDALDESGDLCTVLDGSWIGLSVALRPLLDEAAHTVSLKILNERTNTSPLLKFFH